MHKGGEEAELTGTRLEESRQKGLLVSYTLLSRIKVRVWRSINSGSEIMGAFATRVVFSLGVDTHLQYNSAAGVTMKHSGHMPSNFTPCFDSAKASRWPPSSAPGQGPLTALHIRRGLEAVLISIESQMLCKM